MDDLIESRSPADPNDVIGVFPVARADAVADAVQRARGAFPAWRDAGFDARSRVIRDFAERVRARQDELAALIAREVGKALWDARAEASLVPAKVNLTLDEGMRLVAPIDAGAGARATFHPRGVLVVLGPFNFPAHLPNGHVVPALATGNTVVWKPSELAPAVAAWIVARWREAGLPPGVLELVHGAGDTGRLLALHDDVDGVLFTGSWAVGRALAEATLDQPGKILALEMGGRNAIVVRNDADLALAISETALSICATTGQRCSCASRLFVERGSADAFVDGLVRVLRGVRVGAPLDPSTFMGPLVSSGAHQKLLCARAATRAAGAERLLDGDVDLPLPFIGPGLARFHGVAQQQAVQRDELFGPEAALYVVDDLEQAICAVNDCDFGLAASIFTRDRAAFEHCIGRVRTGLLNWNRGTVGASGRLPFGGERRSGNARPAGLSSTLYCTFVQSRLEHAAGFDPKSLPPGMPTP